MVYVKSSSAIVAPENYLNASRLSFRSIEEMELAGIFTLLDLSKLFFTLTIDTFFDRDELFFLLFCLLNLEMLLAFGEYSLRLTLPQEWLCSLLLCRTIFMSIFL